MHASPGYWGQGGLKISIKSFNVHLLLNAIAFQNAHPDAVVLVHNMYETFGQVRKPTLDIHTTSTKTSELQDPR